MHSYWAGQRVCARVQGVHRLWFMLLSLGALCLIDNVWAVVCMSVFVCLCLCLSFACHIMLTANMGFACMWPAHPHGLIFITHAHILHCANKILLRQHAYVYGVSGLSGPCACGLPATMGLAVCAM